MSVRRIYVEKKSGFDVPAQQLLEDLRETFRVDGLRLFQRYDIEGLDDAEFDAVRSIVFSEPNVDNVTDELPSMPEAELIAIEYLPGQFDQRADSAAQCCQLITGGERPLIRSARIIALTGADDLARIKSYLINAIESREASSELPTTLRMSTAPPSDVEILSEFNSLNDDALRKFLIDRGFAMSFDDLKFCQKYFRDEESRPPTITELRVIDTYWSDHCRHTTFNAAIDKITFDRDEEFYVPPLKKAFEAYLGERRKLYGDLQRDVTLMDIATIGAKSLKYDGMLPDLDDSEEINACSIVVRAEVDGRHEDWLVMFKNETHNHPTEIEPFGGAATCLGGAIRDPLSGRAYVYQAMRITGAADPRHSLRETLAGKLPQRKITRGAAQGFSSYGNQIGLATGIVHEFYHEGYKAKRMEIGAVIAAAPKSNVIRKRPAAGDVVLLVGGRTGRDGIGGATGSSKEHTLDSLSTRGAEVQKGNPPTERKIQRLFRNPDAARLIKRCNDFGAGGVSVAIGELANGLEIDLDAVRKKYDGLDGTELAISESQERMAVVVSRDDVERFIRLADAENLEAYPTAVVTEVERLVMRWRGKTIVDISRKFFDTNGVKQHVRAHVRAPEKFIPLVSTADIRTEWLYNLADLNVCSLKGLAERFDSTIGAGSILMPFGGRNQLTPAEGMAALLPVDGRTKTATAMTFGFNPDISEWSPFHGAIDAVASALAKLTAMGVDFRRAYLSLQEYFEKLGDDPERWGKPLTALLGALNAQKGFGVAAIGGKDSMSGSFEQLHVPPTLVAFAVAPCEADSIISPEFKSSGHRVWLIPSPRDKFGVPIYCEQKRNFINVQRLIASKKIVAAMSVDAGGIAGALSKMVVGNDIGFEFDTAAWSIDALFDGRAGTLIVEAADDVDLSEIKNFIELGRTVEEKVVRFGTSTIRLDEIKDAFVEPLEKIFPTRLRTSAKSDRDARSFIPPTHPQQLPTVNVSGIDGVQPSTMNARSPVDRDAQPLESDRDAQPLKSDRDARPLEAVRDARSFIPPTHPQQLPTVNVSGIDGVQPSTMNARSPVERDARPLESVRDAQPLESDRDAQPSEFDRDAHPLESDRDARPLASDRDAQPLEADRDAQPLESDRDAQPLESVHDARLLESNRDAQPLESNRDTQPLETVRDAQPSGPNRDAHSLESNRDAHPSEFDRDARPSEPNRDAHPLESNRDARPSETVRDAHPSESDRDAQPLESDRDAQPLETVRDAQTSKSVRDAQPLESVHDAQPLETVRDAHPLETVRDAQPLESDRDAQPLKSNRDARSLESDRDAQPLESDRDAQPLESVRDARPSEPNRDARSLETVRDARPLESVRDAQPLESVRDARPLESDRDAQPLESDRDAQPLETVHDARSLESNRDAHPLESNRDARSLESDRDAQPSESDRDAHPLKSDRDARSLEFVHDAQPLKSNRDARSLESDRDARSLESDRDARSLESDRDAQPLESVRNAQPLESVRVVRAPRGAKPRVLIPVFPGTNCEYDSARAFLNAGGAPEIIVLRNLTPNAVEQSVNALIEGVRRAQIIMLPGGFSGGDEPDGSGKFIAAMFRHPRLSEAVMNLLTQRDGLILGICNGFQALIKLGLLPYGEIRPLRADDPTLTHNSLGRHVSCMVRTRIASNRSPWLMNSTVGDIHTIAVSHGEGRFAASDDWLARLVSNGQIATQYVDDRGAPTLELPFNPNGSIAAIEGITSPDGRVFGKMAHSERAGEYLYRNIDGAKVQPIFAAGVKYFS